MLSDIYALGIRPAEPGEFTRRAFLNQRLNLAQAQAVAALIAAADRRERDAALQTLARGEGDFLQGLHERLFLLRRDLEALIDFPEEPDVEGREVNVSPQIDLIESYIEEWKQRRGHAPHRSGMLDVLICGPANAGKSSLIRRLVPGSRPVITERPGTTLDTLPYEMRHRGWNIRFYDSPGFKTPDHELDRLSQENLERRFGNFDATICMLPHGDTTPMPTLPDRPRLDVLSKCDQAPATSAADSRLRISALTGEGLPELLDLVAGWAKDRLQTSTPWGAFEERMAARVRAGLGTVAHQLGPRGEGAELAAYELDEILDELRRTLYEDGGNEKLLDSIFRDFCIGK